MSWVRKQCLHGNYDLDVEEAVLLKGLATPDSSSYGVRHVILDEDVRENINGSSWSFMND